MANELRRRRRASCVERCRSLSPMVVRWQILSLMTDMIEATSPMGEPSKVAIAGSSTWAPGIADRMRLAVAGLVQITSDFRRFKCRPNSDPTHCTISRSWLMSSHVPSTEPSPSYHTVNSDLNWEQRSVWTDRKIADPVDLPVVFPLQTEVCCHAKTGRRVRSRKSGQRGRRLEPTCAWPAASCHCAES